MIYIKSMEIKNFQSHKDSKIEFDRGLNVIIGKSDSGKTAILRAIKWVFYNDPPPSSLIRVGEKEMSVKLVFNTGVIVTRLWSSKENKYILVKSSGEEIILEKFNRTVPFEIIQELQIQKIELGASVKNEINIAEQLDGPFLLNESSSTRASSIGRLIGVNYIDDALRDVIKDNKNIAKTFKELDVEKEKIENELNEFKSLDLEIERLNKIKNLRQSVRSKEERLDYLKDLFDKYNNIQYEINFYETQVQKYSGLYLLENKLEKLTSKLVLEKYYNNLFSSLKDQNNEIHLINNKLDKLNYIEVLEEKSFNLDTLINKLNKFANLKNNFDATSQRIILGEKFLEKFENFYKITNHYQEICNKADLLFKLENLYINKNSLDETIFVTKSEIENAKIDIDKRFTEYQNILIDLGYCPVCHSKIDKTTISEHLRGEL